MDEWIQWRRELHRRAETGFTLEKTTAFLREKLRGMGYAPKPCGKSGVVATLGEGARCVLLRADIDALPVPEKTGLSYACKTGNMHACGHDLHATILLGAAKLLKERESRLQGCVKLLFQPAEEILSGAKDCINAGVLKDPVPQAAFALHVSTGTDLPTGSVVFSTREISAPAADYFTIVFQGKACHGATPERGVDALNVAARFVLALQSLSAREQAVDKPFVLTVGKLQAGVAGNAIADRAEMQGTLRAYDEITRAYVKKRIKELAGYTAKAFGAKASVRFPSGCPTLKNDLSLTEFAAQKVEELLGKKTVLRTDGRGGGSEDFAYIAREVPSVFFVLGAGNKQDGYEYPLHHPKAKFDERALGVGSKLFAHLAEEYLKRE